MRPPIAASTIDPTLPTEHWTTVPRLLVRAGKSPLTHKDPQALLDKHAGTGDPVGAVPRGEPGFKERVDFGEVIGSVNGEPTTKGIIHYSKTGAHIVPARPPDP